jgi:streptomycin 6-kinase
MFEVHLAEWDLVADGEPVRTHSSDLLPVLRNGEAAMLKITRFDEEKRGNRLMAWWNGDGAARVLASRDGAVLLERASGGSLAELSRNGSDDEATRIICAVAGRLHRVPPADPPDLVPLARWFRDLDEAAGRGGIFARAAATARALLADPLDDVVLHGDIHHGNVLDFGERGWLAIDPKGLRGERGFDHANLFCNPDDGIATDQATFRRRLSVVAAAAGLERRRLARWVLAWVGLSILWPPFDAGRTAPVLRLSELAAAEIDQ